MQDSVVIKDLCDITIHVPTGFTPNKDGNNDKFGVFGLEKYIKTYELYVFNRWGEVIFRSEDFYETWDQPEKEFIDKELQAGLVALYGTARDLSNHVVEKTVPVGNGDYASVFSDNQRAAGPRPEWVLEEARVLNAQAHLFVPIYEKFMRLCREKLVS